MQKLFMTLHMLGLLVLFLCENVALAAAPPVTDQAQLLTDGQRQALTAKIQQVEAAHQIKIGICTLQNLPQGQSAGQYANNLLDREYAQSQHGSIVLVVAMGSRDWYISTDNNMRARITDEAGLKGLQGYFLDDLSAGDYNASFTAFVEGVDEYLAYYEGEGRPYDPADEIDWLAVIIALAIAGAGGAGFAYYLICNMSNVAPALEASAYLQKDSVAISQQQDRYLYTTVTCRQKAKSSGSSSSSHDSSHGGGGGKF